MNKYMVFVSTPHAVRPVAGGIVRGRCAAIGTLIDEMEDILTQLAPDDAKEDLRLEFSGTDYADPDDPKAGFKIKGSCYVARNYEEVTGYALGVDDE